MKKLYAGMLLAFGLSSSLAHASQFSDWQPITKAKRVKVEMTELASRSSDGSRYAVDIDALSDLLLNVDGDTVITLPLPDGTFSDFILTPSDVLPESLRKKFPNMRTFTGVESGEPDNWARFEITPSGFHGMLVRDGDVLFIDPEYRSNKREYISYRRTDALPLSEQVKQDRHAPRLIPLAERAEQIVVAAAAGDAVLKRTYRIAVSANGEYTQFHGGTVESGLAAVVTMINRVDGIYMSELGIHLTLVPENDQLIFTNPSTDPFSNDGGDIDRNASAINSRIGSNAYDIGHVVTTGSGGLAYLGAVCSSYKAGGTTGSGYPVNDSFHVDYVAHEIGHQFGGDHTFNGYRGSCNGNRASGSAYEPGSGSTIMGYAGICSGINTQNNSDPFFHSRSLDQIRSYIASGGNCSQNSSTGNSVPLVNAGTNYTIPANTPFTLTGSASDGESDTLTYEWQQFDLGPREDDASDIRDDGQRTIFRAWKPTNEPSRTFPRMQDVLDGSTVLGESYPTTNRDMTFRLIVRDGKGGTHYDTTKVTVKNTGAAFAMTYPNGGESVAAGTRDITWNTAGTSGAPISCASVDIALSTNGGATFSQTLASGVANSGSASVVFPNQKVSAARVKVSCSDNVFFAVSANDFAIDSDGGSQCQIPATPNQPTADVIDTNTYTISWSAAANAETYQVQTWKEGDEWQDYSVTELMTATISDEQAMSYARVIGVNSCAERGTASAYVEVDLSGEPCTAPVKPSTPVASNVGANSYTISWNAVNGAALYQVQRWNDTAKQWQDFRSVTETQLTVNDETDAVVYLRVIAASNCGSLSDASGYVTINLVAEPCDELPATNRPTVTDVGGAAYTLSWGSVNGAASYQVQTWSGSEWLNYQTTTETTFTVTGVSERTAYARIIAINECGDRGKASAYATIQLTGGGDVYQGVISSSGGSVVEPNGNYFQYNGGTLTATLEGPENANFDLYLYKWNGRNWVRIRVSNSGDSSESISYQAGSGYYYYRVYSTQGGGSYTLSIVK
ncbi:hypothetical protein EZV61_03930 [Corallincola luteus]|uniref:Uncharacterized protein n=1 Tax=Corallincola luteus TaxID=1775177 RepID=A0ABY2APK8_9GAMM|nr:zinc-dependent metalloprotease family protein [Corallincola luteus]TCI05120.1 hypothetical protein EZV61_03930 [Corallincola luteus]